MYTERKLFGRCVSLNVKLRGRSDSPDAETAASRGVTRWAPVHGLEIYAHSGFSEPHFGLESDGLSGERRSTTFNELLLELVRLQDSLSDDAPGHAQRRRAAIGRFRSLSDGGQERLPASQRS